MNSVVRSVVLAAALWMPAADPSHMLSLPCLGNDPDKVDWLGPRIPRLPGAEAVVFRGEEKVAAYNNHAYIARFQGRFWAMWSSHPTDGNFHGMHVRYAASADGMKWSADGRITPVPRGKRYVARGFWVREGRLLALASLDSNMPPLSKKTGYWPAEDIELLAFEWDEARKQWKPAGVVYDDTINNYPPWRLPDGDWILARRNHRDEVSFLIGGVKSIGDWTPREIPNPEKREFNEPDFLIRPDGVVAAHLRDNSGSKRIYRSVSKDGGRTWSVPVRTDFPDATSKNFNLRLSTGEFALINNPNPKRRVPLSLAVSKDGEVYDRMGIVSDDDAPPRIPGHDKGAGHTYPHALEHEGHLYVISAKRRDDIVVKKIRLRDVVEGTRVCGAR